MKSKLAKVLVIAAGTILSAPIHGAYVSYTITISDSKSYLDSATVGLYNSGGFGTPICSQALTSSWVTFGGGSYISNIDSSTQYFLIFFKDGKAYKTAPYYATYQDSGSYELDISIESSGTWEWSDTTPGVASSGNTWTDPNLGTTWKYIVIDGEISLGSGDWRDTAVPSNTKGEVSIPSSINGIPVTGISDYAFCRCYGITKVSIPDTVKSIGYWALAGLQLTEVHIPASVTNIAYGAFGEDASLNSFCVDERNPEYCSKNGLLMTKDGKILVHGINGDIKVPDTVETIAEEAFHCRHGLTSIEMPKSVKSIEKRAFCGCTNLSEIIIPPSVKRVGQYAFISCTSLEKVTMGGDAPNVDALAFSSIPADCIVRIPRQANGYVVNANGKWNGMTVEYYGPEFTINENGVLTSVVLHEATEVVIPDSVTSIGGSAFSGCRGLTSVTIGNSVTNIGNSAFYNCYNLTSVTIGNSVTSIGGSAFSGCRGLTSVTIGNSVTNIGNSAFYNCYNLTSVTIGNSVTSIGDYAFYRCSRLTSVTIPDSVTSIGDKAFYYCSGLADINGFVIVRNTLYSYDGSGGDIVVPDSVTSIGDEAFSGCSGLTSVTIPDSVTSIGDSAFDHCSDLTSVTIGNSVTSIGSYAFGDCGRLTSVTIGNSVTSIGDSAFFACSSLTSVTIGNSVTSIGKSAFSGCSGLTSVTIPDSVTNIGNYAFSGCSGLTSVTIPDSFTSIGDYAFSECSGLTSVTIPASVTSIDDSAFSGCSGLTEVFLPEHLRENIGSAFVECPAVLRYYVGVTGFLYGRLTTVDSSETNIVMTASNACKVTFDWKCSCEPLRKGRMYDYLAFSVDGVQQDAICGETDWTGKVFEIAGEGEHLLSWTYRKNEANSGGEDCGWVRWARIVPRVELSFLPGGEETGEAPEAMTFYADEGSVCLPGQGTLVWPKHTFAGWSDGETVFAPGSQYPCDAEIATLAAAWSRNELKAPEIAASEERIFIGDTAMVSITADAGAEIHYSLDGSAPCASSPLYEGPFALTEPATIRAIAIKDDFFDSPEAMLVVVADPVTFGEAVNAPTFTFETDGATPWRRVKGESPDGYALRSGAISHNATSRVDTVVEGEGAISFACKVAGEVVYGEVYDGLAFLIDGVLQGDLMGNSDWATNTFQVAGEGPHTLSWLYVKDENDEETLPEDCAWLDEVKWVSMRRVAVTLDANGGELAGGAGTLRPVASEPVGDLPAPERTGWTFEGWFTAAEDGTLVTPNTVIPNDTTLFAHWQRIYCTVEFDVNGGDCEVASVPIAHGEAIGALPVPARDDFEFLGWFSSAEGGEAFAPDAPVTESMTLYAHWRSLFEGMWRRTADGVWWSGETADNATNALTMAVDGAGTIAFRWKASCEDYFVFRTQRILCDYLSFMVDGEELAFVNGETGWTECRFTVADGGAHTLAWAYIKDSEESAGDDCAWLDGVVWTPAGNAGRPVVEIGGAAVEFAEAADGRTRTATVPEGTAADQIRVFAGGVDVTKGYSRKVEGTTATIALLNPYEVPSKDGAADAPWTEDGEGNVTLNIEVVPGLYYAAASAASLVELKCPGAASPATADTVLVVTKPENATQGFYKVWVSDKPLEAE